VFGGFLLFLSNAAAAAGNQILGRCRPASGVLAGSESGADVLVPECGGVVDFFAARRVAGMARGNAVHVCVGVEEVFGVSWVTGPRRVVRVFRTRHERFRRARRAVAAIVFALLRFPRRRRLGSRHPIDVVYVVRFVVRTEDVVHGSREFPANNTETFLTLSIFSRA